MFGTPTNTTRTRTSVASRRAARSGTSSGSGRPPRRRCRSSARARNRARSPSSGSGACTDPPPRPSNRRTQFMAGPPSLIMYTSTFSSPNSFGPSTRRAPASAPPQWASPSRGTRFGSPPRAARSRRALPPHRDEHLSAVACVGVKPGKIITPTRGSRWWCAPRSRASSSWARGRPRTRARTATPTSSRRARRGSSRSYTRARTQNPVAGVLGGVRFDA